MDPCRHFWVRFACASHPLHSAQVRPSPWYSAPHAHSDTSALALNGHVCSWTPPTAAHPWHGEQANPVPK